MGMNGSRHKRVRRGFSLVEILIAMAIISIIFVVVAALYVQSGETTALIHNRSDAIFEAQEAVERMLDAVRNSDGVTSIGNNTFSITNKSVTSTFSYSSTDDVIMLDGSVYASNITSFRVAFLTSNGGTTTIATDVTKMEFYITATAADTSKNIETSVSIRRLTL
jgi:prepilin-type N-terminal cleavage/methylation domain-containing protein